MVEEDVSGDGAAAESDASLGIQHAFWFLTHLGCEARHSNSFLKVSAAVATKTNHELDLSPHAKDTGGSRAEHGVCGLGGD